MSSVLTEILNLLLSGLSTFAQGIGAGLKAMVEAIFLSGAGTQADPYVLSTFGGVVIIFAGVAIAVGLSRWVLQFITSLGQRNS